ncbi:hypothetical protein BG004_002939 [Podila humilis]|nr:hypothetical protein BG004_002939 [Podila humilis]
MDPSNSPPSTATNPPTDDIDDFGDLDAALLSKILDDENDLSLPSDVHYDSINGAVAPVETQPTKNTLAQLVQTSVESGSAVSSDDDDLAALEELNRRRVELEAKLLAKKRKKELAAMKTTPETGALPTSQTSSPHSADPGRQKIPNNAITLTPLATHSPSTNEQLLLSPTFRPNESTKTPTRTPRALMARTPSPPSRSYFLMSPPSGSFSRKRNHSPSPLPRRDSFSSRSSISGTPSKSGSRSTVSNMEAYRTRLNFEKPATPPKLRTIPSESIIGAQQQYDDDNDDPLDDNFLDQVLDNLEAGLAPLPSQDQSSNLSLTEQVEDRDKRRAGELVKVSLPRPTFRTVAAQILPVSEEVAKEHGHFPSYDPLSKLRIGLGAVVQMTHSQTILPIKNTEQIRAALHRPTNSGALLEAWSKASLSTGVMGGLIGSEGKSDVEPAAKSWVLAGVVGAKSNIRTTAKKARYSHFQLSDLNSGAINVFMFRKVLETHYDHLEVGDVVVIMDPKLLNQTEKTGVLGVEVEDPGCLFALGRSKDFGHCQAVKLNGQDCGRILDLRASAYCQHHILMATNKHRNQRGSLIAGTSSMYDINKAPAQSRAVAQPRRSTPATGSGSSRNGSSIMHASRDTTYIFDDGGLGTSALVDASGKKKDSLAGDDNGLSSFLMSQNNPGGQYLRQAKASKDVAWAKDVTSPKTPTKNSEMFPPEMIRRMGYDPVKGQFVPGSPKRMSEDPEARERSIRLLAERVKSPPAPIALMSTTTILTPGQRKRKLAGAPSDSRGGPMAQGNVFNNRSKASSTVVTPSKAKTKYINLSDGSGSEGDDFMSFAAARERNLKEAEARRLAGSPAKASNLANPFLSPPRPTPQRRAVLPSSSSASLSLSSSSLSSGSSSMSMLMNRTTASPATRRSLAHNVPHSSGQLHPAARLSSPTSSSTSATATTAAGACGDNTRPALAGQPAQKKGKFVDLNDSD